MNRGPQVRGVVVDGWTPKTAPAAEENAGTSTPPQQRYCTRHEGGTGPTAWGLQRCLGGNPPPGPYTGEMITFDMGSPGTHECTCTGLSTLVPGHELLLDIHLNIGVWGSGGFLATRVGTPYLKGKRGWGGGTDVPGSVAPGATHLRSPVTSHGGGCRPRRIFPTSTETRLTEVTTESYVNLRHMK